MRIKVLFIFLILTLTGLTVSANPGYPGYYSSPQYQAPGSMLREGLEKIIQHLASGPVQNGPQLMAFVEQELAPYFDFDYMNYWVMGNLRRHMSPQQMMEMQYQLKGMFLQAMARQLASYQHGRLEYLRPRGNPESGEVSMGIRVWSYGGHSNRLDFRLYKAAQGWKVFDVVADGQSVVAHYRSMFARQAMMRAQPSSYPYQR